MCMYMDNLSIHRSKATAQVLREQRFEVIFNPPYSPFANCIEECFSVVKQTYKKQKLQNIMQGRKVEMEDIIE